MGFLKGKMLWIAIGAVLMVMVPSLFIKLSEALGQGGEE